MLARLAAFRKGLQELGWGPSLISGSIFATLSTTTSGLRRRRNWWYSRRMLLLAVAPASVMALRKVTRTVPIVFAAVTDPVGLGIVQTLARPGGNVTGFLSAEFGFGAKLLELLKEIAPGIRRVIVLTDVDNPSAAPQFAAIQTVAPSIGVELKLLGTSDNGLIEHGISDFARAGNGGLIALRIQEVITQRKSIIKLAAQHRLPAVYPLHIFAADGGLISYGPTWSTGFGRQRPMLIASSRAKSRLTFQCRRQQVRTDGQS